MLPFRLLATSSILLLGAALAGPAGAHAAAPAAQAVAHAGASSSAAAGPTRRIRLPSPDGKLFPYTIEIPADWQPQWSRAVPGLFLGPVSAGEPEKDTRMVYVRISPASLLDPDAVVANIKKSAEADKSWTAPLAEVREVGGVRGVLVRMDSGNGGEVHSTLVLKMPYGPQASLDFMASAPRADFERMLPGFERVILSVLPVR